MSIQSGHLLCMQSCSFSSNWIYYTNNSSHNNNNEIIVFLCHSNVVGALALLNDKKLCYVYLHLPRRICNHGYLFVQKLLNGFAWNFREHWQWTIEQMIKFWWRSGSQTRIRIATLVRRALAKVCTVRVLLVLTSHTMQFVLQVELLWKRVWVSSCWCTIETVSLSCTVYAM